MGKNRKKGDWQKIAASKEAAARAGSPSRMSTIRLLGTQEAALKSAGTGPTAKEKRRRKI